MKIENSIPKSLDQKSVYYIESLASMEFRIECAKHFRPSPKSENMGEYAGEDKVSLTCSNSRKTEKYPAYIDTAHLHLETVP